MLTLALAKMYAVRVDICPAIVACWCILISCKNAAEVAEIGQELDGVLCNG